MKYVMGVNQEKFCELNPKLNIKHLLLLVWFDRLIKRNETTTVQHNGKTFHWVRYQQAVEELPTLRIQKQAIELLFSHCRKYGVLEHYHASHVPGRRVGSYSCFRFADGMREHIKPEYKPYKTTNQTPYQEYLSSPQWNNKRQQVLKRDNNKCTECGSIDQLHVHHITYDRVCNENLEDLVTLCAACHRDVHGIEVV